MARVYNRKDQSVLPPLPADIDGFFLQESHRSSCIDQEGKTLNDYIATGIFGTDKRDQKNLIKVASLFFDLDLKDILVQDDAFVAQSYAMEGSFFNKDTEILVSQAEKSKKMTKLVVENRLSQLDFEDMFALVRGTALPLIEKYLIPIFGHPNKIMYSGHGVHIHYWLHDEEGFTDGNRKEFKETLVSFFKYVKKDAGYDVFDTACKDLGTRLCREVHSTHTKAKTRPKRCVFMFEKLTNEDRLRLADIKDIPTPIVEKVAKARGRGRPKKIKPKKIEHDHSVQFQYDGEEITATVGDFYDRFDEVLDHQPDSAKKLQGKVQCRLVEASGGTGSLKFVAYRNEEKGGLTFWCNAPNQYDHDTANEDTDHWADDGSKAYWWFSGISLELTYDKFGRVLKNLTNLQKIFKSDKRVIGKLKFNSRLKQIYVHRDIHLEAYGGIISEMRKARTQEWFKITDDHYMVLEMILNAPYGINTVDDKMIRKALSMVVKTEEDLSFDPVAEFIESKDWDQKTRVDSWLPTILNLEESHENYNLYSAYGRAMILGITRMIYIQSTYCDVQHTLLIAGPQGIGKSTFASVIGLTDFIGDDYFHDSGIDMGANAHKGDQMQALRGCFCVELPEAISLSKSSTHQSIKAFLTQRKMRGREAYAMNQTEEVRATYFITNSNDHLFLSDPTGNRRFLVVNCFDDLLTSHGLMDIQWLRDNIQQLYAEAKLRAVDGQIAVGRETRLYEGMKVEQWNLTLEEQELQKEHNFKFTKPDLVAEELRIILQEEVEWKEEPKVKYRTIIDKLGERLPNYKIGNNSFATQMGRLGWEKFRTRKGIFWRPKEEKPKPVKQKAEVQKEQPKVAVTFEQCIKWVADSDFMSKLDSESATKIKSVHATFGKDILSAQKKLLVKLFEEVV
tara:strand:+ start:1853 stop:4561 length:2709 start_codon:yes stop_codon:yes gene_type:complete